jgi:hypothetical protein
MKISATGRDLAGALALTSSLADSKAAVAETVVAEMRKGATLHLTYRPATKQWALSSGMRVADFVARLVISRADVVGVGDALFEDAFAQTWRLIESR